jgi:hypothetical protein
MALECILLVAMVAIYTPPLIAKEANLFANTTKKATVLVQYPGITTTLMQKCAP